MPGIKNKNNDSESGEMEQETPESEKSSRDDSDSCAGSDEDDSSEMDEEMCEFRRTECMDDMADLEKHFLYLKEQLYQERIAQISLKLDEVKSGRSLEYIQPLKELQENMRVRIEVAGILRELKLENIKNISEAENVASKQNFESEKMILMDLLKEELEDKIRKLEEDRNNIDINSDLWNEHMGFKKNQKKYYDSYSMERRSKPVTVSGPYIVYMLEEAEIMEDWTLIRKALKSSNSRNRNSIYC